MVFSYASCVPALRERSARQEASLVSGGMVPRCISKGREGEGACLPLLMQLLCGWAVWAFLCSCVAGAEDHGGFRFRAFPYRAPRPYDAVEIFFAQPEGPEEEAEEERMRHVFRRAGNLAVRSTISEVPAPGSRAETTRLPSGTFFGRKRGERVTAGVCRCSGRPGYRERQGLPGRMPALPFKIW